MQTDPDKTNENNSWPNEPARITPPVVNSGDRMLTLIFGSFFLFIGAVVLQAIPFPEFTWYFGHKPQWVISIDSDNIIVGPWHNTVNFGFVGVIVLKMLMIGIPIWIVQQIWFRKRKSR